MGTGCVARDFPYLARQLSVFFMSRSLLSLPTTSQRAYLRRYSRSFGSVLTSSVARVSTAQGGRGVRVIVQSLCIV
jgi:hypothetical protein